MSDTLPEKPASLEFQLHLSLIIVACVAMTHYLGVNSAIPMATTAAMLAFSLRKPVLTSWEHLQRLYMMRVSRVDW